MKLMLSQLSTKLELKLKLSLAKKMKSPSGMWAYFSAQNVAKDSRDSNFEMEVGAFSQLLLFSQSD